MNFDYYIPTRILFGAGRLNDLHKQKLPGKKALPWPGRKPAILCLVSAGGRRSMPPRRLP